MDTKKFSIKKNDELKPHLNTSISNVFNQDSEEDEGETAPQKFERKYAGNIKSKDKRLIESAIEDDPTVYEYDSIYEKLERQKNEKTEEQKTADMEKKPKYVDNIKKAHERRELEKLIHDEHTYKKERLAEAGKFDEKEVYVTEVYRKKIEERNKLREEIEKQDALDELGEQTRQKFKMDPKSCLGLLRNIETALEKERKHSKEKAKEQKENIVQKSSTEKEIISELEKEARIDTPPSTSELFHEIIVEKNRETFDNEQSSSTRKVDSFSTRKVDSNSNRKMKEDETEKRMKKIREILMQRNSEDDITEARKKYFQRLASGEIIPPLF